MTLHQINAPAWNSVLGPGGTAQPGDVVELLPGLYTGQVFKIQTPGAPGAPIIVRPAAPGVIFDGEYLYPNGPAANAGPAGLEVIYQALIQIPTSHIHLEMAGAELIRTRGHGVQAAGKETARLADVKVNGLTMTGLRSAGIRLDYVDGFEVAGNTVTDAGNYWPAFRDGALGAWPMTINAVACSRGDLHHNTVTDCYGEGINASRGSSFCEIHHNKTRRLMGAHYYAHGCSDTGIFCNLGYEWGDYLRAGSPPDLFVINPGEIQYEGKQALASERIRIFNNIGAGGYHNFGVWAGGSAPLTEALVAHNTFINAQPGAKRSGHGAVVVRGAANVTGLRFIANMFHQADSLYGAVAPKAKAEWIGNGWDTGPGETWGTKFDWISVALRNPDAPLVADGFDLRNYEPMAEAADDGAWGDLLVDGGGDITADYRGRVRRWWTVGALEYLAPEPPPPPPPPVVVDELLTMTLSMRLAPGLAAELRQALAGQVVGVEVL